MAEKQRRRNCTAVNKDWAFYEQSFTRHSFRHPNQVRDQTRGCCSSQESYPQIWRARHPAYPMVQSVFHSAEDRHESHRTRKLRPYQREECSAELGSEEASAHFYGIGTVLHLVLQLSQCDGGNADTAVQFLFSRCNTRFGLSFIA